MGGVTTNEAVTFSHYFAGKLSACGQTVLGPETEGQKRSATCTTEKKKVTWQDYDAHLRGERGLGIIPINEDDKCYFGAIDIDEYSGSQDALVDMIYKTHLPIMPFYSKSRGIHIFLFFREPVPASTLIGFLKEIAQLLGVDRTYSTETKTMKNTEIFPKQKSLADGTIGSWINLPYFGTNSRMLINEERQEVPFLEAIQIIEDKRTTQKGLRQLLDDMPFADGPPCLQQLTLQGVTQARNNYLFSAGVYFKAKLGIDAFEQAVRDLNDALPEPVEESELESTVLASNRKQEYAYKCSDVPLCSLCEASGLKESCKKRKYGVGGSQVSELSFGRFVQVLSDPPYYLWDVTGRGKTTTLKFFDEQDIIKQEEFRRQAFRNLHFLPAKLKDDVWQTIVNNALVAIEVQSSSISESGEGEISWGAIFKSYIQEFLNERRMAKGANKSQLISMNKVFEDDELQAHLFRPEAITDFLFTHKQFRVYKPTELGEKLREIGATMIGYKISEEKPKATLWAIPYAKFPKSSDNRKMFLDSLPAELNKGASDEKEF